MKRLIYIVLPLFAVLFLACNPEKKYAQELNELTSLNLQLDSIINLSETIDYDSLDYIRTKANEVENIIKQKYSADTINTDFANKMNYIKRVRKSLKDLELNKLSVERESDALKKQFTDLQTDIKNGVLNADQIKQYLGEEKDAFGKFQITFKSLYLNQQEQKKNFYYAYPTVLEYVKLINQDTNQK